MPVQVRWATARKSWQLIGLVPLAISDWQIAHRCSTSWDDITGDGCEGRWPAQSTQTKLDTCRWYRLKPLHFLWKPRRQIEQVVGVKSARMVFEQPGQTQGPGLLLTSPARRSNSRRCRARLASPVLKKGACQPALSHGCDRCDVDSSTPRRWDERNCGYNGERDDLQ